MTFVPSDRIRRTFTAAFLLSLVLALGAAHAASPTTVRIGLLNFESETSYLSRRDNVQRTMVEYLQEKIPELRIEPHYYTTEELTRAIERREVEFFLGSSGFYVTMLQKGVRDVATLISPNFPDPNQVVAGAIFVRADRKDLTDLASLEDKTAVSTHPLNFMTYQINLGEIAKAGYDPDRFFRETIFTNNRPVEVMRAVLEGRADVGFLRACMVEGISERHPEFQGKFRFINRRSGPREERLGCRYSTSAYPGWTMAVVPHTPAAITHRVALALLSMKPDETPAGYSWSLATNFEDINKLFRTLRVGPYEYLRHWTVRRVFEEFWPVLLFLLGVFSTWVLHWWRVEKLVVRRTRQLEASIERERETEETARKLTGRLDALQRTRTVEQLSSIFAHDLGQPLSAMRYALRGLETLLRRSKTGEAREGDDERIAECLKTLRAQLGRSADMIERVRSYAKRRDGRENPVDLKKVAREVVNEVGQSKSSRTAVTLELPEEETVVEGNGLELFLLLLNLLKNAQRATEEAKASSPVRVRLIRTSEKIRLTVENDGRPLSEEEVAKLGTPFSTTSEDGLGLGLVIVQSIAEAHRAKLLYRARETGGLSVSLDFPPFARSAPETEPSEGHEE